LQSAAVIRNRLLALIALVLTVFALKWSYAVTMPLAAAVFIIAAVWPVKPLLDRVLPSSLSYAGTVLALLLVVALFGAGLYVATSQVVHTFSDRNVELRELYASFSEWARAHGVAMFQTDNGYGQLLGFAQLAIAKMYALLAYGGFVAVLVVLGLPEMPVLRKRLGETLEASDRREVLETVDAIADKFRRYVAVTTLTSLITGVASALWAYAVGLELALTWGVLNFLLNYIPIAGNIIGILPPTLYAALQFRDPTTTLVVFCGYAVLQIAISNFLYPLLQGRGLALSPLAIVVSLSFWSWLWGIPGALLAVPLTAAIVIVFERFAPTAWIAKLATRQH
jgi:predicted PurR-regulated permease PerM